MQVQEAAGPDHRQMQASASLVSDRLAKFVVWWEDWKERRKVRMVEWCFNHDSEGCVEDKGLTKTWMRFEKSRTSGRPNRVTNLASEPLHALQGASKSDPLPGTVRGALSALYDRPQTPGPGGN